jgi:hypothetical protein
MSKRWPGGIVTKNQATPTGNFEDSSAPGIWTLSQVAYWVKQALWPTPGVTNPSRFIENLFSTYLYTGNGSTQTITNGIDLSGKGGLVWLKQRSGSSTSHHLFDTNRGTGKILFSNSTSQQLTDAATLTSFNSNGFSLGSQLQVNTSGETFASWTFREQPKFFDVVTYSGNYVVGRQIAHNLGSVPGMIIVKATGPNARSWQVYHRSLGATKFMILDQTSAADTASDKWNNTEPTSTYFTLGDNGNVNATGENYVAYLFAHNAGGFGLSGAENVISCGSYIANGTSPQINLGYEAQWVMVKSSTAVGGWYILDNMRSMGQTGLLGYLDAASTSAEPGFGSTPALTATATGFTDNNVFGTDGRTMIYIAIRRGPMQVPTTGTSVFIPYAYAGSGAGTYTTGLNQDLFFAKSRVSGSYVWNWYDRLRGVNRRLQSNATDPESATSGVNSFDNTSMTFAASDGFSSASPWGGPYIGYALKRAPGFFDEVCFTPTGIAHTESHNLGIAPELIIGKSRDSSFNWYVYAAPLGNTKALYLNTNDSPITGTYLWNNTSPTSTNFSLGTSGLNTSASIASVVYLFATVANVSKVGSYTGTGATQTINAGLASGARFVMIKRTDSTGDWFVWDTARGMVAGTDPRLTLNLTSAESNANWVYTVSTGFQIVTTDASVNASGGTYIYLAIA